MSTPYSYPSSPDDDALPPSPLDSELQRLEARLGSLVPADPGSDWIDAAIEKRSRGFGADVEPVDDVAEPRGWLKFVPLGIAAVVMITGGLLASRLERSPTEPSNVFAAAPEVAAPENQLVAVCLENSLRETEPDDVVEVEGYGLMRPVMLHFESAQCWVDPETETSVEVIRPWQELVFYPVNTY